MAFQEFDVSTVPDPVPETVPPFREPRGRTGLFLSALRVAAKVGGIVNAKRTGQMLYRTYFKTSVKSQLPGAEAKILERGKKTALPWQSPSNALFPYTGELRIWTWGSGPPVLLVHGFGGRPSLLAVNFVDSLVEAGYSVVALELPGHAADTSQRSDVMSAASAIEQVVEHIGEPLYAILGHSFGVCAAALATARGVTCKRFVGIASVAWLNPLPAYYCDILRVSPSVRKHMLACVERAFAPQGLPALATERQISSLDCPVLIIHDRKDPECDWSGAVAIFRACSNATLRFTSGLGHYRILRDQEVRREAVEFIKG